MNRNQRIALAKKDLNVTELGKILDRSLHHVSNVLAGRYKCYELRKRISIVLGKPVSHLWPDDEAPQD